MEHTQFISLGGNVGSPLMCLISIILEHFNWSLSPYKVITDDDLGFFVTLVTKTYLVGTYWNFHTEAIPVGTSKIYIKQNQQK